MEQSEQITAKNQLTAAKDLEVAEKDRGLVSLQQRCGSLQTELETVQRKNQHLEVSIYSATILFKHLLCTAITRNLQAGQSISGDLLALKDSHIAALQTELRAKNRMLQARTKVGGSIYITIKDKLTLLLTNKLAHSLTHKSFK